jgi:hypothetical protein
MTTLRAAGPASDIEAISYGAFASVGFVAMFFMYHYCKFYTTRRPEEADTQFMAGLLESLYAIPFVKRLFDYFDPPLPAEDAEEVEEDLKKPAAALPPIKNYAIIVKGRIVPLQPRRTQSAPTFTIGATALSPISEDGSFFFDDLPSPASAP